LIPVNGVDIYYARFNAGGGNPVILLHGGLGSSEEWGFEVPRLATTHDVITIDCRGRGRSTTNQSPMSYELMESDLLGVMDSLHIEKASIVGSSDGGIIGLLVAIDHPDRVDRLFAFGANFSKSGYKESEPDTVLAARFMARAESTYRALSPTPDSFAAIRGALGKMYSSEPEIDTAKIAMIHVPTVIADGEFEQFIKREHTEKLAHLIPGARLVIVPDVGHGGPQQDPQAFHLAVASLLDSAQQGRIVDGGKDQR
jgi:pimeloyl-ACP methyl ester carboxylesterase